MDLGLKGHKALRDQAESVKRFFKEREQRVTGWDFQGDTVTVRVEYEAVLAENFLNYAQAGQHFQLQGVSEFGFRDGKIVLLRDIS